MQLYSQRSASEERLAFEMQLLFVKRFLSGVRFPAGFQTVLLLAICFASGSGAASAQESTLPVDTLETRAERAADAGSTAVAIELYSRILERDSTDKGALWNRANLYSEQGKYEEAASDLGRYQEIDPTPPDAVIGARGWYLTLAGDDLEKARELSRRAVEMDPSPGTWQLNLGHTFLLDEKPRTAKYYYREAIARIESRDELKRYLSDFNQLAKQGRSPGEVQAMEDWFHVTYLSEGEELRSDEEGLLAFLGTWITLVVGLISLFQRGGEAMTENSRSSVRTWLLRERPVDEEVNWADSFKSLFDAVFTESHLSWTCFYRSALTSIILVTILLLGMVGFGVMSMYELSEMGLFADFDSVWAGTVYAIAFGTLFNIPVDYVSLFQTRWVIEKMAKTDRTSSHLSFLLLDAVLTIAIFFVAAGSLQVTSIVVSGQWFSVSMSSLEILSQVPLAVLGYIAEGSHIVTALFVSTFFTSVWVWLYVGSGFVLQGVVSLFRGVDWMRRIFDVEGQPVQALGIMLAVLTTAVFALSAPFVL